MLRIALCIITAAAAGAAQNPFEGKSFYVNPSYQKELNSSIATATGAVKATLEGMLEVPSAFWVDVMAKINGTTPDTVEGILKDAGSRSPAQLVTLIVYDLPNRDCHAKASNGEICCTPNADGTCNYNANGDCSAGLNKYKTQYINPLAALVKEHCTKVPMVLIIEPDSLPNLATNQGDPHCGNSATKAAYEQGIPYAIETLSAACPQAALYLDAAHGGWLGWTNNIQLFAQEVTRLNVLDKLRGFSTNVANYQPIGIACPQLKWCLNGKHQSDPCCADPCHLEGQYNPAQNEANYVMELAASFPGKYFITDTGRNGVPNMRSNCANWCNIRGAGVGRRPTTATNSSFVDAYYWLKTPGESDGCTQTLPSGGKCSRYDSFCGSTDSIGSRPGEPDAPVAGGWFDYQIKQLAANSNPNLF
eukprot:TRINITY_DN986_c0_g2_i1.p1 TRINITY_DN986_c0_g2~~TRINITY_DN986_c0_g2_i1.p1  ORF type:complete len:440 (+),score=115.79 TRINITY_DN986_c0_g2_i1:65-1321(+)